jgi:hypothetical protein
MPNTFIITGDHLEAFSRQQTQRFEDEMVAHLRKVYPAQSARLSEPELRALVAHGIITARGYNILLEPDVARYIEFMLTISPNFDRGDEAPWAAKILTQRRVPANAKLDAIAAEVHQ